MDRASSADGDDGGMWEKKKENLGRLTDVTQNFMVDSAGCLATSPVANKDETKLPTAFKK